MLRVLVNYAAKLYGISVFSAIILFRILVAAAPELNIHYKNEKEIWAFSLFYFWKKSFLNAIGNRMQCL